jgi:uncharacterized protein (DUF433 family)
MNLPEFLVDHPDGEIRLTGHRIGLYHVVDRYQDGYSPEMLAELYPTLPLALIHKVIAFYLENQAEVDAYVAAYRAELERQEAAYVAGPAHLRIRQLIEAKYRQEINPSDRA